MGKVIWKYPVPVTDLFEVEMPIGAEVITVQMQGGAPYMWALVDSNRELETRFFRVAGTGNPLPDTMDLFGYLGTFQMLGGQLVWHLFERPPESEGE